jgi:hypothetical protein
MVVAVVVRDERPHPRKAKRGERTARTAEFRPVERPSTAGHKHPGHALRRIAEQAGVKSAPDRIVGVIRLARLDTVKFAAELNAVAAQVANMAKLPTRVTLPLLARASTIIAAHVFQTR